MNKITSSLHPSLTQTGSIKCDATSSQWKKYAKVHLHRMKAKTKAKAHFFFVVAQYEKIGFCMNPSGSDVAFAFWPVQRTLH